MPEGDMIEVIIDGERKEVTLEELKAGYQKGQSADQRFQTAAEATKKAQEAIAVVEAMAVLKSDPGNETAFRTVAKAQGWGDEDINKSLAEYRQQTTEEAIRNAMGGSDDEVEEEEEEVTQGASAPAIDEARLAAKVAALLAPEFQKGIRVGAEHLEPRLQKAIMSLIGKNLSGTLESGVDKHEVLGKFNKFGSPDQKEMIHSMVTKEARRRAATGDDPQSSAVQAEVLQVVSDQLGKLGVRPEKMPVPTPGLGSSGSGLAALHPEKPLERSKDGFNDPRHDENLVNRIMQAAAQDGPQIVPD